MNEPAAHDVDHDIGHDIRVEPVDPTSDEARLLIDELSELLAAEYGSSGRDGFEPTNEQSSHFVVAFRGNDPAGCGALRPLEGHDGIAEVKRMYSRPGTRGVGRAVLQALEQHAVRNGHRSVWLETRRANLRAIGFYERAGYRERPPYGKYVERPEAICMEKDLPPQPR